jgi:ABC-2 type transport system ATP-binding protein
MQLYKTPVLSQLLAPVIGASTITTVGVDVGALIYTVDGSLPVAFTTMVPSVHGALISVNWFPASGLEIGETAPTILNGPGLGTAGNIDPTSTSIVGGLVPGLVPLRGDDYNVITWDPRGEFASTGILQLDSPAYEGQDVSSIIDFADTLSATQKDGTDPLIGMVGGSYGGGIQLVAAGIDSRIDAIVPGIAWNNLSDSLYPSSTFKTSYASLLLLSLVTTGARINTQIYIATVLGDLLGVLTQSQQALLNSSGPDFLDGNITAPTLFIQGTVDVLFPLEQALANAAMLPPTTPSSTIWFCGGHGACLTLTAAQQQAQTDLLVQQQLNWLDEYVKGEDIPDPPKFQWIDQTGAWHASDLLPSDPDFNVPDGDLSTTGSGGTIPIIPLIGGSGPQSAIPLPYSLGLGAPASNAVNLKLDVGTDEAEIAGAPTLTMTYSGIGTSRSVYAQIVDTDTGQVVGNIVTPIPVTLNGQQQTVTIPMEDIAYTVNPDGTQSHLTLQIVTSATPYLNLTQFGVIHISSVGLSLPVYNPANNAANNVPLPV